MKENCVICGREKPVWGVVDMTTGFHFCSNCHNEVIKQFATKFTFSDWLRAIANVRDSGYPDIKKTK